HHPKIPYAFYFSKSEKFILPFSIQITEFKSREELITIFGNQNHYCVSYTPYNDVLYISKKAYEDCMKQTETKSTHSFDIPTPMRGLKPVGIITDDCTI